jgi:alpha,alpha-trehalase
MPELRKKLKNRFYRAQINLAPKPDSPDELLGELFQDVQIRRVFPDSMTFVDMIPAKTLKRILKAYRQERQDPHFELHDFVEKYFTGILTQETNYVGDPSHTVEQHIEELWTVLRREIPRNRGSLIGLPHPYIVCGGRYIAQFYWDSYFDMIGLAEGGHWDIVESMVKNCAFLIRRYGFVPNGNRTYYTSRSQPPVFALMVQLLAQHKGKATYVRYLPYLQAEYNFWMKGSRGVARGKASRRVVRLPDGAVLNRYFDNKTGPRPEGYKEDVEIALRAPGRTPSRVYLDLRAGAESGWDYSSRWLRDPQVFETIHTTDIIPVDLNALLYNLEMTLVRAYEVLMQPLAVHQFKTAAARRAEAINEYCWNKKDGFYYDFDFVAQKQTDVKSLAALFPLFVGQANQAQADAVASMVHAKFLQPGGVVTSLVESGQQWDWPNGWAPLQWVTIAGLRTYGHKFLAEEIKERWVANNVALYKEKNKLVEKYNAVHPGEPPLAGEYELPDGFGWTNGVLIKLLLEGKQHEG